MGGEICGLIVIEKMRVSGAWRINRKSNAMQMLRTNERAFRHHETVFFELQQAVGFHFFALVQAGFEFGGTLRVVRPAGFEPEKGDGGIFF